MQDGIEELKGLVVRGDAKNAPQKVQALLDSGAGVEAILNNGLISAMSVVGEKYENKEYFVPELLVAARAMQRSMEILKPLLKGANVESQGTLIIGTVKGDQHDIGKNLVSIMFEGAGFEVVDLGINVSPAKFVEAIRARNGMAVLGMSALLTTTMPVMSETISALKSAGIKDKTLVIVGGA